MMNESSKIFNQDKRDREGGNGRKRLTFADSLQTELFSALSILVSSVIEDDNRSNDEIGK
jgi:hypothetical protein